MTSVDLTKVPQLTECNVAERIRKSNKPKSRVVGDLPKKITGQFYSELAKPITKIYKKIVATGQWPDNWKIEYGILLQKQTNPLNEDMLRIISLT